MSKNSVFDQVVREWVETFMHRSFSDFKRFMDDSGLSPSQVGALMRLHHCESCGVTDIGGHLGLTNAAASQLVERLVNQNLLKRSEDPHDRRFKQVALTQEGKALILKGIQARTSWMEQLTDALTPADQEITIQALTLLTKAARQLENDTLKETVK